MIVYRIADQQFIDDRIGTGAKLFGGRWNYINIPCLYSSEHISLALLERFAHARATENMINLALLGIELPDDDKLIVKVEHTKLKSNWVEDIDYTQWLGKQILDDSSIMAFSVPSAIIPEERNIIINTSSKYFKQIKFEEKKDFIIDYRLLGKLLQPY